MANIGIENFRDIGGYFANGRKVKQNMAYRSAKLDGLTDEGELFLDSLKLKTIVDFRGDDEIASSPTLYSRHGLAKLRIPIFSGDIKSFVPHIMSGKLREPDAKVLMCSAYRSFVTAYGKQYAHFLDVLLDKSNYPVLFHCTAGKDRTGYAAALLLSTLGVQWDDVLEDYLLTNDCLKDFISKINISTIPKAARKAFGVFMVADEEYLDTAFSIVGKSHEKVSSYVGSILSFGKEKQDKLQSILLE